MARMAVIDNLACERDYWLPEDVHTDSDNMTTKIYATWQRAGRLYTVKAMSVVWENDEPQLYWSLRTALVKKPTHAMMEMVNVDQRTLMKHMVSEYALTMFARGHGCLLSPGHDYAAFTDALIAMDSVTADIDYWRTVSMLAGNGDDEVHVFASWVVDKNEWLTSALRI